MVVRLLRRPADPAGGRRDARGSRSVRVWSLARIIGLGDGRFLVGGNTRERGDSDTGRVHTALEDDEGLAIPLNLYV